MGDARRVTYTPHPDTTPAAELAALSDIYRIVLLESDEKKEAAHPGGPDDAERRSNEIRAKNIIPK